MAVFGLHALLCRAAVPSRAARPQPVSADRAPDAVDPAAAPATNDFDRELKRAETLLSEGSQALAEGREIGAREAFDAALDVFVDMKGPSTEDPRFLSAYSTLIDRIVAAEVAKGSDREAVPVAAPPAVAATQAAVDPAAPPGNSLAELGDRIENANPAEGARESNEAVLGSEVLDLPIELNDQVLGAIDLYSGRFNKWFSEALSRGIPHLPRIREILAEAGIPTDLAYVPIVESAFNPSALSSAKARGLWQFIPSTGRQYGLRQDFFVDERSSIEKATVAAAQYLKKLYTIFGDWNLALAGYNAGRAGSCAPSRRPTRTTSGPCQDPLVPGGNQELRAFDPRRHRDRQVPGVVRDRCRAPERGGLRDRSGRGVLPHHHGGPLRQRRSRRDQAASNPELRREPDPLLRLRSEGAGGLAERVTACLAGERAMDYTRHVIRRGDTFSRIAGMFGVSATEIARANDLTVKSTLRPGVELAIPRREPGEAAPRTASYRRTRPFPTESARATPSRRWPRATARP